VIVYHKLHYCTRQSPAQRVNVIGSPGPEALLRCVCNLLLLKTPEPISVRGKAHLIRSAHSSKCIPRFGSARRLSSVFRTVLSGRTTMTGTGECLRQYFDTPPMLCEPKATPNACFILRAPREPTMTESGRYSAMRRSIVVVTLPAMYSTMIDNFLSDSTSTHLS
jgi:hypothetical protein